MLSHESPVPSPPSLYIALIGIQIHNLAIDVGPHRSLFEGRAHRELPHRLDARLLHVGQFALVVPEGDAGKRWW
jgi:hypothetical protein